MSSQPLYRLNWLREEQGGHLTGHDTAPTVSLDSLPINETLAARILAATPLPAAAGDAPPPPLYLPFLSYRDRHKWPTRQMELPVTTTPDGRILVGNEAEVQMAGLIAGQPTPFVFTDRRRWDPEDWDARVVPLLEAHHMETPQPRWRPAGPVDVSFTITLPAEHKRLWREIPHRREADFLEQFRGLSTSIQRALRQWMPYQYFNRPSRYSKPLKCHQYLVYSELPAFPSRRKTQLTFHVLEPQRVIHSMSRLAKPLTEPLRKAARRARGLGFDPLPFLPDRASHILRTMHKMPRAFGALLSLEAFLVEEFILFAATCFDLREENTKARALVDPALELRHRINCRLARSYGGESYENLLMLIMAAATDGLQRRAIEPHRLDCRATIADARTGQVEFEVESKTSYATSEIGRPLLRVG